MDRIIIKILSVAQRIEGTKVGQVQKSLAHVPCTTLATPTHKMKSMRLLNITILFIRGLAIRASLLQGIVHFFMPSQVPKFSCPFKPNYYIKITMWLIPVSLVPVTNLYVLPSFKCCCGQLPLHPKCYAITMISVWNL
ncbi:hypothetical protein Glove_48g99 [Diversispora epigaea]|uniref:Uncharacterized protein n=1 Tax=Diversispora epigaea TaxID=1348612 RepID=A0A397JP50_9GLOM|nr:hypothetical protein Glove_48g97 [Diversispora epigaea]RHZ86684.1 hypothetical protein Glove_48g99 [Diversispora epigaea]